MPASSKRQPMRACSTVGTARLTASTRSDASASMSRSTRVPNSAATFCARSALVSTMPTSSAPSISRQTRTWLRPKSPTPTTATRMGFSLTISFSPREPVTRLRRFRWSERLDRDARFVGGANQLIAIEQQRSSGVDRKRRGVRAAHHFDGFQADDRYIESHVLPRLAHFHDDQALAAGDARGALDGFVGSFHRFDGHAGAIANHHRLAQIERRRFAARFRGRRRCRRLRTRPARGASELPPRASSGPRNLVESTSSMPSSSSTRATAPISESVFFDGSENSNFASRQSGRIELKILLCFTCPAITACFTPS